MNVVLGYLPMVVLFAILGLLFQSYRGDSPAWHLDIKAFAPKLKGYWTPLFLLVAPLAFVYNTLAMAVYAVMVLFEWLVRLIRWLVGIVLWIWNKGFMWYWRNVVVVPIVLVAKVFWHYVVVWPWRIYKTSYHAIKDSFSREGMRVGWLSMALVATCVGVGYWLMAWLNSELFLFLGILAAEVPYLWGMGVLASMRESGDVNGANRSNHEAVGFTAAKLAMKYVGASALVLLTVYLVAYSGAIPDMGYVVLGVLINVAHAATMIGVGVCLVLFLALAVLPSYVLDGHEHGALEEMMTLIRMGRDSFLKVVLASIPASVFGAFVALIPVLIVGGAYAGAFFLKGEALGNMAGVVSKKEADIDAVIADESADFAAWSTAIQDKPGVQRRSAQIDYLVAFPQNLLDNPSASISGIATVDFSEMRAAMEAGFASRSAVRNARLGELESAMSALRSEIQLEMDERSTYTVERSADDGETWKVIAEGVERSGYVDTGLSAGEKYRYRVTAKNRSGSSDPGNVSTAYTTPADISGPSRIRARTEGNFRIVVSWNDNDWNEEGFTVERSNDGKEWSQLAKLGANSTFYVDESVRDTTYAYRVTAFRGEEVSEPVKTNRNLQPSLPAPRSEVAESNSSSALVVWSHNADYRRVDRGGSSVDGDGGPLSFNGKSRLEALQEQLSDLDNERADIEAAAELDEANTMPRLDLLAGMKADPDASRGLRVIAFLLGMLAIALLTGFAMSTLMSYIGGLNQLVVRLTDGEHFYFAQEVRAVRKEHDNQPLLGFLLLGLTGAPMAILLSSLISTALAVVIGFFGLAVTPQMPSFNLDDLMPVMELDLSFDVDFGDEGSQEVLSSADAAEGDLAAPDGLIGAAEGTYIIQCGFNSVWRELVTTFGRDNYEAIREANSGLSQNEWAALSSGDVILLPEGLN